MNNWYRKELGTGAAVFQRLRELRALRLEKDAQFGPHSLFIVALDVASGQMIVFLPPGNKAFALSYGSEVCSAPVFDQATLVQMSDEYHPAQPPIRTTGRDGNVKEAHAFVGLDTAIIEALPDQNR